MEWITTAIHAGTSVLRSAPHMIIRRDAIRRLVCVYAHVVGGAPDAAVVSVMDESELKDFKYYIKRN